MSVFYVEIQYLIIFSNHSYACYINFCGFHSNRIIVLIHYIIINTLNSIISNSFLTMLLNLDICLIELFKSWYIFVSSFFLY